jgi:hypothetical protein
LTWSSKPRPPITNVIIERISTIIIMLYYKDGFIFKKSKNPAKKYDVYDGKTKKKINSFGARGMYHYFDKIGAYSSYNHLDKERRKRYYARHGKSAKPLSAKYFSSYFLW